MQRGDTTVTVPLNNPVKKSTLKKILNQAGISVEELIVHLWIPFQIWINIRFNKQIDISTENPSDASFFPYKVIDSIEFNAVNISNPQLLPSSEKLNLNTISL